MSILNDIPKGQLSEVLFSNLVLDLSSTAMFAMGKIANPSTGKVERDLDLAQMTIEMLAMLQEKTSGNLNDKEAALLITTLTNLRLTFVKETEKPVEASNQ
jgi:hypothetical protein